MDPEHQQSNRLLIGDLILDKGKRQISRGGLALDLPKLSYQLVLALAEAAPNVLTQDELVSRVWPGRIVSPETITQRIKLVRQALGDDANEPRYIGLVRGEGYRIIANVEPLPAAEDGIARNLIAELGRRRVLQVAVVYAAIAWSITEVISFLLDALPVFPEWSKALVAITFIVGFPVAMFLAWRFDIGPGGIRRTEAATAEGRLTIAAACLLLIGATAGLFYLIYPRVLEQADVIATRDYVAFGGVAAPNTIAVLPFANASENPEDLYMSDGLGDELRDQLGRVAGLRVAARSSSVIFRNQEIDAIGIADRLGVGKLVEGTLRREGNQLRITVSIIDGETGFQDWTRPFDHPATNLLAAQQEIAAAVVRQMLPESDATLEVAEPATLDASAHDLMLLARHYYQQVKDDPVVELEILDKAIEYYHQATLADPDSALAHSRLGDVLLYLGDIEHAEEPIFRALALDPNLSEVQYTLGLYRWLRFLPASGEAFARAVELNPNNADALEAYAKWIWHIPDPNSAEPYLRRALELDPMSLSRYGDLGNFLGLSGQRDKALALARQITARFHDARSLLVVARIYEHMGSLDEAIGWALHARKLDPNYQDARWMLAELYARIGDFKGAHHFEPEPALNLLFWEQNYEELIDLGEELAIDQPNQIQIFFVLARAYVATGRYEQAIYVLQRQGLPQNVFVESRRANAVEAMVTLAEAYLAIGKEERAHELADWLAIHFEDALNNGFDKSWWPAMWLSCTRAILGDDQQALDLLERAVEAPGLLWYPVIQDFYCFQRFKSKSDPRYTAAVAAYEKRLAALRNRLPDTLARFQAMQ